MSWGDGRGLFIYRFRWEFMCSAWERAGRNGDWNGWCETVVVGLEVGGVEDTNGFRGQHTMME